MGGIAVNFEEIFGSLAGDLDIVEYESQITVKPKRRFTPQEFLQVHQAIMRHGGTIAGTLDIGPWFTMPKSPEGTVEEKVEDRWIPVDKLIPPSFAVRVIVNEAAITELINALKKTKGRILEPLIVRLSHKEQGKFEVVIGSRRLEAAKRYGLTRVRCNMYEDLSDQEAVEWQLIENEARADLTDYERGRAMKEMLARFPAAYPNQTALGVRFGMDHVQISHLISHYEALEAEQSLPPDIAKRATQLSEVVTRQIRNAPEHVRRRVLVAAVEDQLSARETKALVETVSLSLPSTAESFDRMMSETRKKVLAEQAKQAAFRSKLLRTYSEEFVNDVLPRAGKGSEPEKFMMNVVRLTWLNAKETGAAEKILDEARKLVDTINERKE
jgi:ParB/RepB/Spo0J family partition protein